MLSDNTIYNKHPEFVNIPQDVKALPNWVLWRKEMASGRLTKVPYQPNGQNAKSNDKRTWRSFSEVADAFIEPGEGTGPWEGIGWCVPLDSEQTGIYFWGIDVDDAINPETKKFRIWGELPTDEPNPPLQPKEILDTFQSYSEVTPSGAGFRIFILSSRPVPKGRNKREFGERNPKTGKVPGIEIYSSGRFFTFTGVQIDQSSN